jgi:hypothetical protein
MRTRLNSPAPCSTPADGSAGASHRILNRQEIPDLEPNPNPALCAVGFHWPESGFVRFPQGLAQAYFDAAVPEGGHRSYGRRGEGLRPALNVRGNLVRLDTEWGYHIGFDHSIASLMRGPVVFPARSMVLFHA